jgi:hypothetical protein
VSKCPLTGSRTLASEAAELHLQKDICHILSQARMRHGPVTNVRAPRRTPGRRHLPGLICVIDSEYIGDIDPVRCAGVRCAPTESSGRRRAISVFKNNRWIMARPTCVALCRWAVEFRSESVTPQGSVGQEFYGSCSFQFGVCKASRRLEKERRSRRHRWQVRQVRQVRQVCGTPAPT